MDLLAVTSGSRSLQARSHPEAGSLASTAGSLSAVVNTGDDDGACEKDLQKAKEQLEDALERANVRKSEVVVEDGNADADTGDEELSCDARIQDAITDSKVDYMKSALHGDVMALKAMLAKHNATLAAEWDSTHAAYPQRGIMMLAGPRDGSVYLINAFVTLWVIRHHFKSKLPVVIMYWGKQEAVDPQVQAVFKEELGEPSVSFVDATLYPWPAHHRQLFLPTGEYTKKGWAIKLAATYFAPFQEVLYLDTDSTPIVAPETLFDLPAYTRSGSQFWPCIIPDRAKIFDDLIEMGLISETVAPADMMQTESGQWLLDKRRHREALELILFLGTRSDYGFLRAYGDKEMYLAGFALAGATEDFNLVPGYVGLAWGPQQEETIDEEMRPARRLRGFVQFSPVDGSPLFLHRAGGGDTKYRLEVPEGRPLDVISGPVPSKWAQELFQTLNRRPWPETLFRVVDARKCPYSLDKDFPDAVERCGGKEFSGKEEEQVPVFSVDGSAMAKVHAAQEEGWKRLLEVRKQNKNLFPMSLFGKIKSLWAKGDRPAGADV